MADNVLAKRRRGGGTNPRRYVDNYDAMSDRLHPRTREMMDPTIDALERSQVMRGARRTGPDFEETNVLGDIQDAAESVGWKSSGGPLSRTEAAGMLQAAAQSDLGATDGGISAIVRAAKTYGLPNPFGGQGGGGADYAFGGRRPTSLQRNPEIPYDEEPDDAFAYRVRRR